MTDQAQRLREMFQEHRAFPIFRRPGFSRVISIASGKGGVGKTNLVVNLAIVLGQLEKKIIILDTDIGLANVDILFDLKARYNLVDVLRGYKDLSDIILQGPCNIEIVPGGSSLSEMMSMDSQQREQLISRFSYLEERGDFILIDCPAGLSHHVLSFVAAADDLLLVTTPDPTAIADAYSILKAADHYNFHSNINLVVNMVRSVKQGENVYHRIKKVCRHFLSININYLGCIEFDEHVQRAVLNCFPFVLQFPRSTAAQNMREIASRLLPEKEPVGPTDKKGEGLLKRLLRFWC